MWHKTYFYINQSNVSEIKIIEEKGVAKSVRETGWLLLLFKRLTATYFNKNDYI